MKYIIKEFKHVKIEECALSKKKIDTSIDEYCVVLDYRGDNLIKGKFYSAEEFKEFIKGNTEQTVKILEEKILYKAKDMLSKVGINLTPQEVVDLKV